MTRSVTVVTLAKLNLPDCARARAEGDPEFDRPLRPALCRRRHGEYREQCAGNEPRDSDHCLYPPALYGRRDFTMSAIRKVGMLGLGKMGAPMARHLLAKGYNVAGYDPVDDARKQARSLGVSLLDSPRDVARASDVVIVVVC